MNAVVNAAFASWAVDPRVFAMLALAAFVYLRGWIRIRRQIRCERDGARLACFLGGLVALFLALESPLDAFDNLFLSAHMAQHLLLMMVAPPLLLLSHPVVPMLRGSPKQFVKEGLGPFLTWPALRRILHVVTAPPFAWSAFAISTIAWHVPAAYEVALRSPAWHNVQHASFFWTGILFWWPVVQPGPGKPRWPRWAAIPYLLAGDLINTALSAIFVFSGRVLYPSYEAVHAGGVSPVNDQILAGIIMWAPGSLIYLIPALVLAVRIFSGDRVRRDTPVLARRRGFNMRPLHLARMRRAAQFAMLLLAIAVMLDGFAGRQIAPLNLAGVLPWIHWRALSIFALLVFGNLFCMACPFTFVRDIGRKMLPARWRWPRALRTKWLSAGLIVIYLWAYEAFALWNSPWMTTWIIAGYFVAALAIDGLFRGASFCKYVCPIGQFHFVTSLVSPREVRVRSTAVCKSCSTYDCIRGNDQARGCELFLFQPKKASNLDCTFCLDCVKACPHENVAILPVAPAATLIQDTYRSSIGRLSKRIDWAALALVIVFGAFVNAAGMVTPVMQWEHSWHARLGPHAMPWIVAAFVLLGAGFAPLLLLLNRRATRLVYTLVPLGIAMWAAHLLFHFANFFAVAAWLPAVQILLLDSGLLLALYLAWKITKNSMLPWAALACALYATGIWILFQPMQMRGM